METMILICIICYFSYFCSKVNLMVSYDAESIIVKILIFLDVVYNIGADRDTLYTHDIELTFKRYVISSIMRSPFGDFLDNRNLWLKTEY